MYFWLKFFHIAAMAVWFTGLFFLPRVFVTRERVAGAADDGHLAPIGNTLYFGIMTPAGVITVVLGLVLMSYGFDGAWLPIKLGLVTVAVLFHIYTGQLLFDLRRGQARHGATLYRLLNWLPLLLLLGIVALAAAKPATLAWPG